MMMTSPMSDEMDAKGENNDRYDTESRRLIMLVERLMNCDLKRSTILVHANLVPHQRIREVHVDIKRGARVDSNVLRTRQHL